MTICRLNEEGRSQRDIAGIVGLTHKGVCKIIAGYNYPCVKSTHQEEPSETTGGGNTSVTQSTQEEPLSAFVHATSVEPILNPFGDEEGRSLRDIAGVVGIHHSTVEQLVGVGNTPVAKNRQEETTETSGGYKTSVTQSTQEEPLSAFVHATSVDPILNPFGDEVSSQRDIAGVVGLSQIGVLKILGDNNNPSVKSYQKEEETTGGENYPCVKIPQEEPVRYVRS
jgi:hypothetical protein